jgi:hypothetical protein
VGEAISRAEILLERPDQNGLNDWRRLRAQIAAIASGEALHGWALTKVTRRDTSDRKIHLSEAQKGIPNRSINLEDVKHQQHFVNVRIVHARGVLVREAIAVFGVQYEGDWQIAGLRLSAPEDFIGESCLSKADNRTTVCPGQRRNITCFTPALSHRKVPFHLFALLSDLRQQISRRPSDAAAKSTIHQYNQV